MSMPLRVLIVEDSEADARLMLRELQHGGFEPVSLRVETPDAMRAALAQQPWDVILSDYTMPQFSAPAALHLLQEIGLDIPFIIVSGTIGEDTAVEAMRAGAQDYLLKGNLTRLVPAIVRELRDAAIRQARRQAEANLQIVNRGLRVLSSVSQALMRATTIDELFQRACQLAVDEGGYRMVWIGMAEHDPEKTVRPVCYAGYEEGYLDTVQFSWDAESASGRGPTGTAIRTGEPAFARDIAAAPEYAPWRKEALARRYRSSIAVPLKINGHVFGTLNLYSDMPDAFPPDEVKLLTEMANDMAYGIMALRTREHRQRAEAALRENEERLRTVLATLPVGVTILDRSGHVINMNSAFERIWAGTASSIPEVADIAASRAYHGWRPDTQQELLPEEWASSRALLQGETIIGEVIDIQRFDGTRGTILNNAAPLRSAQGEIIGAVAAIQDITQVRQAEEDAQRERAFLSSAIELLPFPILFIAPTHEVIRQNKAGREMLPASDTRFGWAVRLLNPQTHIEVPAESLPVMQALRGEVVPATEWIAALPDGREFPVLFYSAPILIEGRTIAAVVALQDISPLKEADRAKNQFLNVISHEMRTPLTAIIGWTQLAQDDVTLCRDALQAIEHSADAQKQTLDRLIILSRILTGKLALVRRNVDAWALMQEIADTNADRAIHQQLTLQTVPPAQTLTVIADPHLLRQAFTELVDNAISFTPAGGRVTITGRRDGDRALITIEDTGRGFIPEQLVALGRPFLQFARREEIGGVGIGLALAGGIVEQHGGQLVVSSSGPGRGSTVSVVLPLVSAPGE